MTAVLTQLACTVEQSAFKSAVGAVAKRLPSRPAIPALACVKLTVDGDRMTIAAFDYETSATAGLAIDGQGDGIALVSGRLLSALVDTLPAKPVQLTVEDGRLKLTCGTVKLGFPTVPVEDYPQLPALPPVVGTVDADVLARAVRRVAAATHAGAEPHNLTGLWFGFGDQLDLMASDRYRAAADSIPWAGAGSGSAVPAAHVIADVVPLLAGEVTVYADDTRFGLSDGNLTVVAAQIAEYPAAALRNLIDSQKPAITVELDGGEFAEHLGRANKVHEKTSPVVVAFADGGVSIAATGQDSTDASAAMDCDLDGEPIEILINPEFLIAGVKAVGPGRIALKISAATKPVQVLPVGGDTYRHLIVPIRKPS